MSAYLSTSNLAAIVDGLDWLPGWTMEVYDTPVQGPCLALSASIEDFYHPGTMLDLRIKTLLPPFRNQEEFLLFLRWRLAQVAEHESDEALRSKLTGKPVFDPHAEEATEPA